MKYTVYSPGRGEVTVEATSPVSALLAAIPAEMTGYSFAGRSDGYQAVAEIDGHQYRAVPTDVDSVVTVYAEVTR